MPRGRLMLSPLPKEGGTLRRPPAGRWHEERDFLEQFSSDILLEAVDGSIGHGQIVRGVPSVFAQPIYFTHALENEDHPAHRIAVGQWRGVLACFALARWLGIEPEVERFVLIPEDAAEAASRDGVFRTVLAAQIPAPREEWREWWLLRVAGALVGATSPWSLVYPPAEPAAPGLIPWQRDGLLIDPLDHYDPRRRRAESDQRELQLLAAWVDRVLEERTGRWGSPAGGRWNRTADLVTRLLSGWKGDLAAYRSDDDRARQLAVGPRVPDPYAAFLRPVAVDGKPQGGTVLRGREGRETIVLLREGMEAHQRVHGSVLVGELDLAEMAPEGEAGWRTRSGRTVEAPYLFPEEVFLTPKLCELPLSEHALSMSDGRFALPLTTRIFDFFTPEDLRQGRVRVTATKERDGFEVRLTLPLEDGTEIEVRRTYQREHLHTIDTQEAPALALWPDFVSPEWRHSLAILVHRSESTFAVTPLGPDGREHARSALERDDRDAVVWELDEPISGFALHDTESEATARGLVLRANAPPPAAAGGGGTWQVAVDFGTSNTQIMVKREGEEDPEVLMIEPRTIVLTRGADVFQREAEEIFFPAQQPIRPAFPTALLRNQGWSMTGAPGLSTGDLYSPRFKPKPGADLKGHVRNLKWPQEGAGLGELAIREYLAVLVRGVAAEAVDAGASSVVFHWSYPISLPKGPRNSMKSFWKTVPERHLGSPRLSIAPENGRPESEAASRYFAVAGTGLAVRAELLSVAIDIGGGSTDIGFWSAGNFYDQLSFKLAGNDLLGPVAARSERLLHLLFRTCLDTDPLPKELRKMASQPEFSVNAILHQNGERVPNAIHGEFPAGEPPWSIVRSVIYLYFTGISFFVGLHARKLFERVGRDDLAIRFGGKAAGLLPWVSRDSETLAHVLKGMAEAGLAYADRDAEGSDVRDRKKMKIQLLGPGLSQTLPDQRRTKTEVAHGLLLPPLAHDVPRSLDKTLIGEEGWSPPGRQGEPLAWHDEVGLPDLMSVHAPPRLVPGLASSFVLSLVRRHHAARALDEVHLNGLELEVSQVENEVRRLASQGVLQPIFATELGLLIRQYVDRATGGSSG